MEEQKSSGAGASGRTESPEQVTIVNSGSAPPIPHRPEGTRFRTPHSIYARLGIRPVVNGYATLTRLGGSRMPPPVLRAMAEAAAAFVDLEELQRAVGRELARITRNEAAYVCCGAAAGITLAAAACMAGCDPERRARLPDTTGMPDEVIVHRHTRVGFDYAIRMTGARLVEIGSPSGTTPGELEAALSERTAAVFYFPKGEVERGELPLETAVGICRPRGVPVVVDAAAQIPPAGNLWSFTGRGADLAIFSGGKGLRGPQSSGLVVGKRAPVEAVAFHGPPHSFIGRGMKVGKEEMCGLLAAVEWYLSQDEPALLRRYEEQVAEMVRQLNEVPGLRAARCFPCEAGQPIACAMLEVDEAALGMTRDALLAALRNGEPCVELAPAPRSAIRINPQTLAEGEEQLVIEAIRAALRSARG